MCSFVVATSGPADGHSTHTGPKGVLEDYRRFCELETERHEQLEHEQVDLARRLCLATRTVREDQSAQKAEAATLQAISDTVLATLIPIGPLD